MKVLIFGANGQLGQTFAGYYSREGLPFVALSHAECDITSAERLEAAVVAAKPDVVINCAAYNLVDAAEDDRTTAFAVNADGPRKMAEICRERKIRLVHFSTDYVFDGRKRSPYVESDPAVPLNTYGQSKLAGEEAVLKMSADNLVFRVSWVVGPGERSFFHKVRRWLEKPEPLRIADDEISVPTFTDTIVGVVERAIGSGITGLFQLTNSGWVSRYELTLAYLRAIGRQDVKVIPVGRESFGSRAKRPGYSVMSNELIKKTLSLEIPLWSDDLLVYVRKDGGQKSN